MKNEHYLYDEDSSLLGVAMDSLAGGDAFLEIGVGGGANLQRIRNKFRMIVGTDLEGSRTDELEAADAELVLADLASCFRTESFDAIAFNPPYLPSERIVDKAVDGGSDGMQVPFEFLSSALHVLKTGGQILMLVSDLGAIGGLEEYCRAHDLKAIRLVEKKLFFETLFVYEITRRQD